MSTKLEPILAARGVEYRQGGQHEIMVRCPLCGSSDPSQHLAISTRGRGWRCLRNPVQHRGKSYQRLLSLLIHCDIETAAELLGERVAVLPDQGEFSQQWRKQLGVEDANVRPKSLEFPRQFRRLEPDASHSDPFWDYLLDRGYTWDEAVWVARAYDLHFAVSGRYAHRIIIPIKDVRDCLMTWTARSINPKAEIRYMTLKKDEAVLAPGELLLGLPVLHEAPIAKCLVVGEGPFDAMAVSALGRQYGVLGTCLFGLEASIAQADLLVELSNKFPRTRIIIDPEAWLRMLALRNRLPKRVRPEQLPKGVEDPGALVGFPGGKAFVRSLAA